MGSHGDSKLRAVPRRLSALRDKLKPHPRKRLSRSQLAGVLREKEVWIQIAKNLRELEGSWAGVIRRQYLFAKGDPKKKTEPADGED